MQQVHYASYQGCGGVEYFARIVFSFQLSLLAEQECIVKRVEQLLGLCDALEACLQSGGKR